MNTDDRIREYLWSSVSSVFSMHSLSTRTLNWNCHEVAQLPHRGLSFIAHPPSDIAAARLTALAAQQQGAKAKAKECR